MKYDGKKLPSGWSYILTKKDLIAIDNETGNFIISVKLGGTSYSESKMATQWLDKKIATIDFSIIENNLCCYISLHGVKDSNFNSDEELLSVKTKAILDITTTIIVARENFLKFNTKSPSKFIKAQIGRH
jgi:hypothetical protein